MSEFSIIEVFDEFTDPSNPKMDPTQAEAAVAVVQLADTLAGDNLDLFGEELVRNGRHRLTEDSTDVVGEFLVTVALRLSAERQKRKYQGPSRQW